MKPIAPTAKLNRVRVTKAKAAYHRRLYFTPEYLQTEGEKKTHNRKEKHNMNRGKSKLRKYKRSSEPGEEAKELTREWLA